MRNFTWNPKTDVPKNIMKSGWILTLEYPKRVWERLAAVFGEAHMVGEGDIMVDPPMKLPDEGEVGHELRF